MGKFKVGDRVVVVKTDPSSSLDENHFIGEAGEIVEINGQCNVTIKFDNHSLKYLWNCEIMGAEPIYRRFNVDSIETEPAQEDFYDQLANILSL